MGPGPLVVNIILITVVRVYVVRKKVLEKTETEQAIGFFVPFLSLVAFQMDRDGEEALDLLATSMGITPPESSQMDPHKSIF